mmetsp:Transcript_6914/g.12207  ORF Transcript_6914/g.12207 Transcript_6914/m.12207 type:complete len:162 (+) Transcript_6914:178-663(+)|eukprot:CAMPEP_0184542756 /NCGR_PEP_ID=MMETSP0199_2-20130426/2385_1 /TAXON_ID=1112570 /ORGANISM="Thraustochytrium sp., Strain LLF1b" /LENGTH=161 /DNA_ID=CAMNT_0026936655 /DNA_START=152 /DNA_END=637 /DNA_ORIENTATION=+
MVSWPEDADSRIEALMDDKNRDVDFVIFSLEGKKDMVLNEDHIGKGGRAKVEEILKENDDKVMVGAFLALGVDDREVTVSIRRKYIHFIFVGSGVSVMTKGRVNSQSGEFKNKFSGCHLYLQLMGDLDDLQEAALEKELLSIGGAHKPGRYDWTNSTLDEA